MEKFNLFTKCTTKDKVKHGITFCNGKTYQRCRWSISNKHLKEVLISYGCVPNKSLILKFPDESIFSDKSLIRHFIRGYWDGDGCLSWGNKEHTYPCMEVVGTESFLISLQRHLNLRSYKLQGKQNSEAKQFSVGHSIAFNLSKYLYSNSTIYLQRKYEKYLEYCRLYEESYRELQTKIGEGCDVNPEVIEETKESSTP